MSGETVPYVQPYFQILTVFWRLEMKPESPGGRGQEFSWCQLDVQGKVLFCKLPNLHSHLALHSFVRRGSQGGHACTGLVNADDFTC